MSFNDENDLDFLFECVDMLIEKSIHENEYTLLSGERVKAGSQAHINDLEKSIKDLERRKNAEKRGSAVRQAYADARARLKAQLKKAYAATKRMKQNLGIK